MNCNVAFLLSVAILSAASHGAEPKLYIHNFLSDKETAIFCYYIDRQTQSKVELKKEVLDQNRHTGWSLEGEKANRINSCILAWRVGDFLLQTKSYTLYDPTWNGNQTLIATITSDQTGEKLYFYGLTEDGIHRYNFVSPGYQNLFAWEGKVKPANMEEQLEAK